MVIGFENENENLLLFTAAVLNHFANPKEPGFVDMMEAILTCRCNFTSHDLKLRAPLFFCRHVEHLNKE
jgi:hypothetical protein